MRGGLSINGDARVVLNKAKEIIKRKRAVGLDARTVAFWREGEDWMPFSRLERAIVVLEDDGVVEVTLTPSLYVVKVMEDTR